MIIHPAPSNPAEVLEIVTAVTSSTTFESAILHDLNAKRTLISEHCFPIERLQVRHSPQILNASDFSGMKLLTKGSRMNVYVARSKDRKVRKVVLKMLRNDSSDTSKLAAEEFSTELSLLLRVNHPNIVRLVGAGSKPKAFLAIECCERGTMAALLRSRRPSLLQRWLRHRPPFQMTLMHAHELGDALDYLHYRCHPEATIIHRDLKPDNVGFTADGALKLFDLGLCICVRRQERREDTYQMTRNTGSLRYMAPEVALGKAYNEKVDVYSFGVLVWQMLSREVPFASISPSSFLHHVGKQGLRPTIPSSWAPLLKNLITRCWSEEPSERPSMEDVVDELSDILQYSC